MQGTPQIQFANIRKMVLCQGLPHYLRLSALTHTSHVMPKVSTQVHMLDRKIWKLFRPCGNGRKRANLLSNIRFLWFLQSMFLLSYLKALPMSSCGFCWQSLCRNLWPQFVYIAVLLDWKINIYRSTGDQYSHNKLATLVPSVWVLTKPKQASYTLTVTVLFCC